MISTEHVTELKILSDRLVRQLSALEKERDRYLSAPVRLNDKQLEELRSIKGDLEKHAQFLNKAIGLLENEIILAKAKSR